MLYNVIRLLRESDEGDIASSRASLMLLTMLAISTVSLLFFAIWKTHYDWLEKQQRAPIKLTKVSLAEVVGPSPLYRGFPSAPFTLVEFADYQCPACAFTEPKIERLFQQNRSQLRIVYRNFPLSMHPQAYPAALFAEEARYFGRFWEVHDALYKNQLQLGRSLYLSLMHRFEITTPQLAKEKQLAEQRVHEDVVAGKQLGVDATPSFFLATPKGKVYRLGNLNQVTRFVTMRLNP